jgi:hypothetical protein
MNDTIITRMQQHGGSFAKALAHAWTVASPANREVLELAFAGLFATYKEDATK